MNISNTIFQTWKTDQIPDYFQTFADSWKNHHPTYDFQLWSDEMNETFISENYADFLPIYKSYPHNIQRADAIRYFLLYHYGGIYVDLDILSLKNITPLIEDLDCFFGIESTAHNAIYNTPMIASNALMGCVKNHPFFEKILEELYQQNIQSEDQNQLVLHSTGPFMLNRVLDKHPTPDVVLIDSKFVSPLSYLEAESYVKDNFVGMSRQLASAYCIHLHWGSWWKSQS